MKSIAVILGVAVYLMLIATEGKRNLQDHRITNSSDV
jgi:hypothetical protein